VWRRTHSPSRHSPTFRRRATRTARSSRHCACIRTLEGSRGGGLRQVKLSTRPQTRVMAQIGATPLAASPVVGSPPDGDAAAATVELIVQCSSTSSLTRSSGDNEESGEAAVMPENSVNASAQARATEDDALQSQMCRVCPRTASTEGGPEADLSEKVVLSDTSAVRGDSSEAAATASNALSAASLLEQLKLMVLCGSGGPVASGSDHPPVEVTKGLVLFAAEAVRELFSTHREQIQLACGELDEREALAYLIADAVGVGLITTDSARKAGDKSGKLVWVKKGAPPIEKELADAKRAVQRRASKLPEGVSIETEFEDARAAVLRTVVQLLLDKRPVERARPQPAAGRQRVEAPPPPPPPPPLPHLDPRLVRWCGNQWPREDAHSMAAAIVRTMSRRVHERKARDRAWNPRTWQEREEKRRWLAVMDEGDQELCTCEQGTLSWLCRVNLCYATAVGSTCEERALPGRDCDCMGWKLDELHMDPSPPDRWPRADDQSLQSMMRWQPPTPAAGWPAYDTGPDERRARLKQARAEQKRKERALESVQQRLADAQEDRAILRHRATEATPAPAPMTTADIVRMARERPEACAKVKAVIIQQDLSEEQKMAEIRSIVHG
jgi:hypothetical protein